MNHIPSRRRIQASRRDAQAGAAIIEFALVAMIFITLLIGTMEFGRWLFTLNAANEATRLGARLAVVCSKSAEDSIKLRMQSMVPGILTDYMHIDYKDADGNTCDETTCKMVTVRLSGATFNPLIPLMGNSYPIPAFATSLPREFMRSIALPPDNSKNPVCP